MGLCEMSLQLDKSENSRPKKSFAASKALGVLEENTKNMKPFFNCYSRNLYSAKDKQT